MDWRGREGVAAETMKAWQELLSVASCLRFGPHDIAAQLDARHHYAVNLAAEFPFLIKLFHYTSRQHTRGGNVARTAGTFSAALVRSAFAWAIRKSHLERGMCL